MTKAVNKELIDRHMFCMGVYWESGRASSAPELEEFDWREWGVPENPDGRAPVGSADQNEPNE
eukprot:11587009-Alexandrium_andersonii.AAC.1